MGSLADIKTTMSADTRPLKKGSQEAIQALKSYERAGNKVSDAISSAFGVSNAKISESTQAIQGAFLAMSKSSNQALAAIGNFAKNAKGALTVVGGAITAITAGWKEATSRAEYYWASVEGGAQKAGLDAYLSTLKGVVRESANLKAAALIVEGFRKSTAKAGQWVRAVFQGIGSGNALSSANDTIKAADATAKAAEVDAERMYELQRKEMQLAVQIRDIDAQIAELKLKAKDATTPLIDREQALVDITSLLNERQALLTSQYDEMASLQEQINSYTFSTLEDEQKVYAFKQKSYDAVVATKNQLREVLELARSLSREAQTYTDLAYSVDIGDIAEQVNNEFDAMLAEEIAKIQRELDAMSFSAEVLFVPKMSSIINIGKEIEGIISNTASSLGEALGDILSGATDPKNALLGMLADLAITVGNIAISIGTTMLALNTALRSIGPAGGAIAIAAGVALVALGTLAKNSLSAAASGGSSSPSAAYGSSASGGGILSAGASELDRSFEIEVTGTIKTDNNALLVAVENAKKVQTLTT